MDLKTKRPADAAAASARPRKTDQLAREIGPTNTPAAAKPQAPPLLADTAGEDDFTYFRARPHLSSRKRLAFEGEGYDSAAFVSVRLKRDPGLPARIIRAPVYGEWGRA